LQHAGFLAWHRNETAGPERLQAKSAKRSRAPALSQARREPGELGARFILGARTGRFGALFAQFLLPLGNPREHFSGSLLGPPFLQHLCMTHWSLQLIDTRFDPALV
jgi:hypothetical protein